MANHLDDDENVKAMRDTARTIGLTALLVKASQSTNSTDTQDYIRKALRLLGEPS